MPGITGSWKEVDQSVLDALAGDGVTPLHFNSPGSRDTIQELIDAASDGKARGVFVSGSGSSPDLVIPTGAFPQEDGNRSLRASKLCGYLDESARNKLEAPGAEDDNGNPITSAPYTVAHTVTNYKDDGRYEDTDYDMVIT